jgi:phosphate/sulfate permease
MDELFNFLNGIQTAGWIIVAVVATAIIALIFFFIRKFVHKHNKRKAEHKEVYEKLTGEQLKKNQQPQDAQSRWSIQANLDENFQNRLADYRKYGHPKKFKASSFV